MLLAHSPQLAAQHGQVLVDHLHFLGFALKAGREVRTVPEAANRAGRVAHSVLDKAPKLKARCMYAQVIGSAAHASPAETHTCTYAESPYRLIAQLHAACNSPRVRPDVVVAESPTQRLALSMQ